MKASNFHWLSLGGGGGYKLIIYTHHGVIFSYRNKLIMLFTGKISETGGQLGKLNEPDSERQMLRVSSHFYKYICIDICVSIGHKYRRETMWAKERRRGGCQRG